MFFSKNVSEFRIVHQFGHNSICVSLDDLLHDIFIMFNDCQDSSTHVAILKAKCIRHAFVCFFTAITADLALGFLGIVDNLTMPRLIAYTGSRQLDSNIHLTVTDACVSVANSDQDAVKLRLVQRPVALDTLFAIVLS